MFTVAKSDAIMQVLPTALRFWEKLGLGPRGGRKNVTAFVLFEDEGEERQLRVERWLNDMSATYSVSDPSCIWHRRGVLNRWATGAASGLAYRWSM